jgi:hypothetical protein
MPKGTVQSTSGITEVRLDRTFNLGNYENIKVGLTASIIPGDDVERIVAEMGERLMHLKKVAVINGGK